MKENIMTEIADINSLQREEENNVDVAKERKGKVEESLPVTTLDASGFNVLDWS